jgi:hypothetical protein
MAEGEEIEHDTRTITTENKPAEPGPAQPAAPAQPQQPPPPPPNAPATPATVPTSAPPPGPQEKVAASAGAPSAEAVMLAAGNLGLTVVDTAMFAQLKDDAKAGRQARDEQNRVRWDTIIQGAVRQGKLAASAFKVWRTNIEANPELVIQLLAAMPEGELPTVALGHAEAYAGPGALPEEKLAADKALADKRKAVWEHFGIDIPATTTPKG